LNKLVSFIQIFNPPPKLNIALLSLLKCVYPRPVSMYGSTIGILIAPPKL